MLKLTCMSVLYQSVVVYDSEKRDDDGVCLLLLFVSLVLGGKMLEKATVQSPNCILNCYCCWGGG